MAIEIENMRVTLQACDSGFLFGFTQRHPRQIGVTVGMPAELQPPVELAVMGEQCALPIGRDQPSRAGEVPVHVLTAKGRQADVEQALKLRDGIRCHRPALRKIRKSAARTNQ